MSDAVSAVRDALQRLDVDYEESDDGTFVAVMPGDALAQRGNAERGGVIDPRRIER